MISRPEGGQDANVLVDAQIFIKRDYTYTYTHRDLLHFFYNTLPRKNDVQIWNEINYKK
jgi:hypothetical protein